MNGKNNRGRESVALIINLLFSNRGRSKFSGHVIANADGINLSQEVFLGMSSNGAPHVSSY